MSNADRLVLVLGGAGTVGSGIVKGLLDKGKLSVRYPGSLTSRLEPTHTQKRYHCQCTYTYVFFLSRKLLVDLLKVSKTDSIDCIASLNA